MKAVLYAAKSTKDPRGSIPTQLKDAQALAKRERLEVVAEFSDEDASAWSGDRGPGLAEAMKRAEETGAALVVQHTDRLARGDAKQARHLVEFALWSLQQGVSILSVEDPATFDDLERRGLSGPAMMGDRNAFDSQRKSDAVKAGWKRRRERGEYVGHAPFGYKRERSGDDRPVLVPDARDAAIVKRVFAEFIAGRSQSQIARDLHAEGVRGRGGGAIRQSRIGKLLRLATYAGYVEADGELVEATHEPIIDRKTWREAQGLLEASNAQRGKGRGRRPSRHLFKGGMLICGECEAPMSPRSRPHEDKYVCYSRLHDWHSCTMPTIDRADVDQAVFGYFTRAALDVEATREELAKATDAQVERASALLDGAEGDVRRVEGELDRIKADYRAGDLSARDWADFRDELETELGAAREERERLAQQLADAKAGTTLADAEQDVLEALAAIREALAGGAREAEGIEAVRASLTRSFDRFVLHRGVPTVANAIDPAAGLRGAADWSAEDELRRIDAAENPDRHCWIEPVIRPEALVGYVSLYPMVEKKPLQMAKKKYPVGSLKK